MITSTPPFSRWKTIGLCLVILLLSPLGWGAIGALHMAPLPRELNWLFQIFRAFIWIGLLIGIASLISLPFIIINEVLVRLMPRLKNQPSLIQNWPRSVLFSFLLAATSILFFRPLFNLRYHGLPHIARNAQPVISAIEKYQKENKQYPDALEELVPKHIAAIPYTGAVGFPNYEYRRIEPDKERRKHLTKETYVLSVRTPLGGLNWDEFLYSPNEEHLRRTYGRSGLLEKFGDWFYLHE